MTVIINELEFLVDAPAPGEQSPAGGQAPAGGSPTPTWAETDRALARLELRRDRVRAH